MEKAFIPAIALSVILLLFQPYILFQTILGTQ